MDISQEALEYIKNTPMAVELLRLLDPQAPNVIIHVSALELVSEKWIPGVGSARINKYDISDESWLYKEKEASEAHDVLSELCRLGTLDKKVVCDADFPTIYALKGELKSTFNYDKEGRKGLLEQIV